ncbi:MAG: trypsin-like serine protease [Armatimonadia bacterium]|nr:trypsin-like serine protease [Armatimonadia bacterium]
MQPAHHMLTLVAIILFVACVAPCVSAQALTADELEAIDAAGALSRAFAAASRVASPAVVNISTTTIVPGGPIPLPGGFFGRGFEDMLRRRSREVHSLGSGCLISAEGHILTNNHVIEGASEITVTLSDERELPARMLGSDPSTDLAVVRVEGQGLPYLRWGDSSGLEVGEWVVAIGSPFGLARTVTSGIVSATGRTDIGIIGYEDLIQTDAAINPGNSGGALVNLRGELVGINTAIASKSGSNAGVGFAVPSNMARAVARQLIEEGRVIRGWIGVIPRALSAELIRRYAPAATCGVFVEAMYRRHPAAAGGMQPGDVITHWAGEAITSVGQLGRAVADAEIGSEVDVRLIRGREALTVTTTVGQQPEGRNGRPVEGI